MAEMFSNEPNKNVFETKFTKGEFKIIQSDHIGITTVGLGDFNGSVEFWHHHGNSGTQEEAEANANLFIAAPDMFNALRNLYDDKEVWSELFESQQEFICRVLNKATGSSFFQH